MHLPVLAEIPAVGVQNDRRIVVEAFGALLEERPDDHDAQLAGQLGQGVGGGTRDRLSQIEELVIFGLAEVLTAEKLLQADDLGAATGGFPNTLDRLAHILGGVGCAAHLHQTERNGGWIGRRHAGIII